MASFFGVGRSLVKQAHAIMIFAIYLRGGFTLSLEIIELEVIPMHEVYLSP
jgi:hypothetical protein